MKMLAFPRIVRRFKSDERGVTAVEFAIVGGPFFLLIFAIIESSLYFFAGQFLESTVDEVTRQFRTGQFGSAATEQQFRDAFCPRVELMFDCNDVRTYVQVAASFGALANPPQPDPNTGDLAANVFTAPGPVQVLQVTAQAKWPVFTNFAAPLLHTPGGDFALISVVAVTRTEPFAP